MLKQAEFNKKTAHLGQFFCLLLAVPTGVETAVRNFFIYSWSVEFLVFLGLFPFKDKPILYVVTENVKEIMMCFVKVEKIVLANHSINISTIHYLVEYVYTNSRKFGGA